MFCTVPSAIPIFSIACLGDIIALVLLHSSLLMKLCEALLSNRTFTVCFLIPPSTYSRSDGYIFSTSCRFNTFPSSLLFVVRMRHFNNSALHAMQSFRCSEQYILIPYGHFPQGA